MQSTPGPLAYLSQFVEIFKNIKLFNNHGNIEISSSTTGQGYKQGCKPKIRHAAWDMDSMGSQNTEHCSSSCVNQKI